jgi:hypothetical protein
VARGMGPPGGHGALGPGDRPGGPGGPHGRDRPARGRPHRHRRLDRDDHHRGRPAGRAEVSEHFQTVLGWADELRRSACAPTPTRPRTRQGARVRGGGHRAVPDGAHVPRRAPAAHGRRHPRRDEAARRERLEKLRPLQQADFEGLFEAMTGLP